MSSSNKQKSRELVQESLLEGRKGELLTETTEETLCRRECEARSKENGFAKTCFPREESNASEESEAPVRRNKNSLQYENYLGEYFLRLKAGEILDTELALPDLIQDLERISGLSIGRVFGVDPKPEEDDPFLQ